MTSNHISADEKIARIAAGAPELDAEQAALISRLSRNAPREPDGERPDSSVAAARKAA